jgi:glycosyltransferase involved in cell wall biosynthesis
MAYNEAASLAATVREIRDVVPDADVLVIDDGSTDATPAICATLAVRVIRFDENRGLGEVYRAGFREATGDLLIFLPADGQFPAIVVAQFRDAIATNDLICGYVEDTRGWAPRLLSAIERLMYRVLFGRMPRFQGVMMVRVPRVRGLHLTSTGRGWTVLMEMMVRGQRAGWLIESRRTSFRPRTHGHSKVRNGRTILSHLRQLVELRRAL